VGSSLKRRIHTNNLTVAKATNFNSPIRLKNGRYLIRVTRKIKTEINALMVKITNNYEEIFQNSEKWKNIISIKEDDSDNIRLNNYDNIRLNNYTKYFKNLEKYHKIARKRYSSNNFFDY